MRIMVEKPDYRGLVQVVTGIPEADQRELLAKFNPSEIYVCRNSDDFDGYLRQMRPPRVAAVAYAGLLGEQRGNKEARMDNMVAMKVAIHKRGCHVETATGEDSRKDWPAMKRAGSEICRRLAQGRRSALNGRKGAEPYEFADKHLSRFALIMAKGKNDKDRAAQIAAYCKTHKIGIPKRTWLWTKLPHLMRERGLG